MTNFIQFSDGPSASFNPAESLNEEAFAELLRPMCKSGLVPIEQAEVEDQIEALVPALVELRDAGHLKLNMAIIAEHGKLDGFMRLADDQRLSDLSRRRGQAISDRLIAQGVKALLGHN